MWRRTLLLGPGVVLLLFCSVAQSQTCEEYFESSLRQAGELKHRAVFRVRMGTVVDGQLRGEQVFGAGRVALSEKRDSLEGGAFFHWVEQRENRGLWTPAYRLIRRETVRVSVSRAGRSVLINISGGRKPVRLAARCSASTMYALDSQKNGTTVAWIFNFPFPSHLSCCQSAILTQHNDIGRTGANLNETTLTPQSVKGGALSHFTHLFTLDVDGQIYAQPLYVPDVKMADGSYHNVLYVATTTNNVYAFDADNALNTAPLRHTQIATPADPSLFSGWYMLYPNLGITATPVIDLSTNKMYIAAKIVRSLFTEKHQYRFQADAIFALDISTLQVVDSALIQGSYSGIDFNSDWQKSRPGLLLLNGRVYVGFGEQYNEGDPNRVYHGWVFSFDAANLSGPPVIYNTTPNYESGGIWQSGGGLASDGTYIYVNTGNGGIEGAGDFKAGQIADSVLKLNADLTLAQSYTPSNVQCLSTCDLDLGSSGPVLFPNSDTLLSGGKEGIFYVFSRKDISKLSQCAFRAADQPNQPSTPYCSLGTDQNGCEIPDPKKFCDNGGAPWTLEAQTYSNIHGSPIVLPTGPGQYQTYVWPEENFLKMFKYSSGQLQHNAMLASGPHAQAPPSSMPGGILSLSAAPDGTNGIVWGTVPQDCTQAPNAQGNDCTTYASGRGEGAIDASVPGIFAAFDANTLKEIWWDTHVGYFAKFNPPTVADGKVFVANFGDLSETNCGGNYQAGAPAVACGHIRVYGLAKFDIRIPIELINWPYIWINPGPLTPGEQEELLRRRRGD